MPIYEFKCNDCDTIFEYLTTSQEKQDDIKCVSCKSCNIQKLLSAGTIRTHAQTGSKDVPSCSNSGFS